MLVTSNKYVCSCKVVLHFSADAKGSERSLEFFRWFENVEKMCCCCLGFLPQWCEYPFLDLPGWILVLIFFMSLSVFFIVLMYYWNWKLNSSENTKHEVLWYTEKIHSWQVFLIAYEMFLVVFCCIIFNVVIMHHLEKQSLECLFILCMLRETGF